MDGPTDRRTDQPTNQPNKEMNSEPRQKKGTQKAGCDTKQMLSHGRAKREIQIWPQEKDDLEKSGINDLNMNQL